MTLQITRRLIAALGVTMWFSVAVEASVPKKNKAASVVLIIQKMQKVYSGNHGFSANFEQKFFNKVMGREDTSTGVLFFLKPNKIKWDYLTPHNKSFIVNGDKLWVYHEQDKQVLVNECFKEDLLSASLSFLINPAGLPNDFTIVALADAGSFHMLRLIPKKPHSIIGEMVLVLDQKSFHIKKSIVKDRQGNINQFTFNRENLAALPELKIFKFVVPTGVSVSPLGKCPANK